MTRTKLLLTLQAVACALLAVLLCASAIDVYRDGAARRSEDPRASVYTPEIAAQRLAAVAPLALGAAGLLVAGLALGVKDRRAERPARDAMLSRDLAASRVARPSAAMTRERTAQRRLRLAGWGGFAACMVPVALYLANPAHFPREDLEGMFTALLWALLPWTALGIGALAAASALEERHARRETEAAKAQLALERAEGVRPDPAPIPNTQAPRAARWALLIAAVAFIALGIFNRGARDVLYKAITICTECIGLG